MHILTERDVKDFLNRDLIIGSDEISACRRKRFKFNSWTNEYSIWIDNHYVDGGQALEELLNRYNNLDGWIV